MSSTSASFTDRYRFWLLLITAIIISRLPLISLPFNWLESFFHELSHGFAAILTGGRIVKIELFTNGAGLCTTQGGMAFVISFMGYAGAIIWGASIYKLALANKKTVKIITFIFLLIFAVTTLLWVRDLLTLIIVGVLAGLFYLKWKLDLTYMPLLLQLTGLLVLLNAVLSPLHLLDGRHLGDGAALSSLTGIPEIVWVILWSSIGIVTLYQLGKKR